jgi:hypothetical protein
MTPAIATTNSQPSAAFTASAAPKEAKFTLKTEDIPDTKVLRVFQNIGFSVPTSTFDLKENNVQKLGECKFGENAARTIAIVSLVVALALIIPGMTLLVLGSPIAFPVLIPGLAFLAFLYGSAHGDALMDDLSKALNWIREKIYGKFDPTGNYLNAQKEFAKFFKEQSPAIRAKLEERLATDTKDLEELSHTDLTTAPTAVKGVFLQAQENAEQSIKNEIELIQTALAQLTRAEAAANAL